MTSISDGDTMGKAEMEDKQAPPTIMHREELEDDNGRMRIRIDENRSTFADYNSFVAAAIADVVAAVAGKGLLVKNLIIENGGVADITVAIFNGATQVMEVKVPADDSRNVFEGKGNLLISAGNALRATPSAAAAAPNNVVVYGDGIKVNTLTT